MTSSARVQNILALAAELSREECEQVTEELLSALEPGDELDAAAWEKAWRRAGRSTSKAQRAVNIRFHEEARDEYIAAIEWYERDYPGRGERFRAAVDRTPSRRSRTSHSHSPSARARTPRSCTDFPTWCSTSSSTARRFALSLRVRDRQHRVIGASASKIMLEKHFWNIIAMLRPTGDVDVVEREHARYVYETRSGSPRSVCPISSVTTRVSNPTTLLRCFTGTPTMFSRMAT
jgi:hypothetical protein